MRILATALAVLLAVALSACGQGGVGTALDNPSTVSVGATAMRPGDEIGFLFVALYNVSRQPLTIQSIAVHGPGVGTVVWLVQEDIAPRLPGRNAAPGAIYQTDPPAMWLSGGCNVQTLEPVRGYVLRHGHPAFLWEVFRGAKPGQWSVPTHEITYTKGGATYHEVLTQEDYGIIRRNAKFVPMDPSQRQCLDKARPLAGALSP